MRWKIPFGEFPDLAAKGLTNTGSDNYGGPVVTAGGLLFIGATNFDKKFHAYDKLTGKLLWETTLPAAGNATPSVYQLNGRAVRRHRLRRRQERRAVGERDRGVRAAEMTDHLPAATAEAIARLVALAKKTRGVGGLLLGIDSRAKALAAELLARDAGSKVLTIDLSRVVSKYIGETEKNLDAVFKDAERAGAQLFFDEADALFGGRTDVNDDHDRYANQVINYLLQRIEAFAGVVILASNHRPTSTRRCSSVSASSADVLAERQLAVDVQPGSGLKPLNCSTSSFARFWNSASSAGFHQSRSLPSPSKRRP